MLATQQDTFDVPTGLTTLLTIRELGNGYQRSLWFENLTADDLAIQLESSTDGGTTWALIGTAFTLGDSELIAKDVPAATVGIVRIRASGGSADKDLVIGYTRMFSDSGHIWQSPVS